MDDVKYFAGKALQGLLSNPVSGGSSENLVDEAYQIALLMDGRLKRDSINKQHELRIEAEIKVYAKFCLEFVKGEFETVQSVYKDFLGFYQTDENSCDEEDIPVHKFTRIFKKAFIGNIDHVFKKTNVVSETVFTNLRFRTKN